MFFEMRDATDPARLPEVELAVIYNDVIEAVEIFLDEPIVGPVPTDTLSPRLVMSLSEANDLRSQLDRALGPA